MQGNKRHSLNHPQRSPVHHFTSITSAQRRKRRSRSHTDAERDRSNKEGRKHREHPSRSFTIQKRDALERPIYEQQRLARRERHQRRSRSPRSKRNEERYRHCEGESAHRAHPPGRQKCDERKQPFEKYHKRQCERQQCRSSSRQMYKRSATHRSLRKGNEQLRERSQLRSRSRTNLKAGERHRHHNQERSRKHSPALRWSPEKGKRKCLRASDRPMPRKRTVEELDAALLALQAKKRRLREEKEAEANKKRSKTNPPSSPTIEIGEF